MLSEHSSCFSLSLSAKCVFAVRKKRGRRRGKEEEKEGETLTADCNRKSSCTIGRDKRGGREKERRPPVHQLNEYK